MNCPHCNQPITILISKPFLTADNSPAVTAITPPVYPSPAQRAWTCPIHGGDPRWVPPGVSQRTGRNYNGFFACSTPGCDQKPPRNAPVPVQGGPSAPQPQGVVPESELPF